MFSMLLETIQKTISPESKAEVPKNFGWATSQVEKEAVLEQYQTLYQADLKGEIKSEGYSDQDIQLRVAQKHVGLAILKHCAKTENFWILPLGREFPCVNIPSLISWNGAQMGRDISRLDGVIIYDKNISGFCLLQFGRYSCTLTHSRQAYSKQYKFSGSPASKTASAMLFKGVITAAMEGLTTDKIHEDLYPDFKKQIHVPQEKPKANQAITTTLFMPPPVIPQTVQQITTQTMARQLQDNDFLNKYAASNEIRISTEINNGEIAIGIIPILPENEVDITITVGEQSKAKIILTPELFKNDQLKNALNPSMPAQGLVPKK